MLQATKIYQEDESYQTASGQFVTFTFTLTDGTEHTVSACAPYVVIDGTGYRTDYEPCQALNMLWAASSSRRRKVTCFGGNTGSCNHFRRLCRAAGKSALSTSVDRADVCFYENVTAPC